MIFAYCVFLLGFICVVKNQQLVELGWRRRIGKENSPLKKQFTLSE